MDRLASSKTRRARWTTTCMSSLIRPRMVTPSSSQTNQEVGQMILEVASAPSLQPGCLESVSFIVLTWFGTQDLTVDSVMTEGPLAVSLLGEDMIWEGCLQKEIVVVVVVVEEEDAKRKLEAGKTDKG